MLSEKPSPKAFWTSSEKMSNFPRRDSKSKSNPIGCWTCWTLLIQNPESPIGLVGLVGLADKRKAILDELRKKQSFRVATGLSKWVWYDPENFNSEYNLREILDDEIVIEFDMPKNFIGGIENFQNTSYEGIMFTAVNLFNAGINFEVWEHEGKSPHLHIRDLPISGLSKESRVLFKKKFMEKYIPKEYIGYVDSSLCNDHMIAIEYQNHWKGCYNIKRLLNFFDPNEVQQNE